MLESLALPGHVTVSCATSRAPNHEVKYLASWSDTAIPVAPVTSFAICA